MRELVQSIEDDTAGIMDDADLLALTGRSVMITGATGLIGVYLVAVLRQANLRLGAGITIHAVSRSAPPAFLAPLFNGAGVRHHIADVSEFGACQLLPSADFVIHAAGYGQPGKFLQDPVKTIMLNVAGTSALLNKVSLGGRFLFVSSSEIYSGAEHSPHRETDIGSTDPAHPRASYIEGKRCGEALCHAWAASGRHAAIARLALAYGPGTRPDDQRVLNSLIRRGVQEQQITLLDHGRARRSYLYVTDAVAMLLTILLMGHDKVYNVAGQSSQTILQIAKAIGDTLDVPVHVPPDDAQLSGAPGEVSLDMSRYQREFGKRELVTFGEGLRRTIAWQRILYGARTKQDAHV
jgi:nucleoside-diphosphate-sugar epimerase